MGKYYKNDDDEPSAEDRMDVDDLDDDENEYDRSNSDWFHSKKSHFSDDFSDMFSDDVEFWKLYQTNPFVNKWTQKIKKRKKISIIINLNPF